MNRTKEITKVGLIAAILCIIGPFMLVTPFSPVPVSLITFMLYLSVYILKRKEALISCGIYLLIGLVGLPVFSGFSGGIGKVWGPTGGYLIGYLFLVYISGWFMEKWNGKKGMQALGFVLGTMLCYMVGSIWLAYQTDITLVAAVVSGVAPFVPGDIIKIVLAVLAGNTLKKRLKQAGVL